MAQVLNRENQRVFINQTELRGAQTVETNIQLPFGHTDYAAMSGAAFFPNGAFKPSFSIDSIMLSNDVFLAFTGNTSMNGYIVESIDTALARNLSFTTGYLTSYSTRCGIGQIPNVTAQIDIFGDAGSLGAESAAELLSISQGSFTTLQAKIPSFGSINVSVGDFNTNRILSYDITLSIPRRADYCLGSRYPVRVVRSGPIQVTCGFSVSAKDFDFLNSRGFPRFNDTLPISITVFDSISSSQMLNYSFPEMVRTSQNSNSNVNGPVSVTLGYVGYLF